MAPKTAPAALSSKGSKAELVHSYDRDAPSTFESLSCLDNRLVKALEKQGLKTPTLIQRTALPIICQDGRDILGKAKTGSGKTLVYVLPILMKCLSAIDTINDKQSSCQGPLALILVPSKELAKQLTGVIESLLTYFPAKFAVSPMKIVLNLSCEDAAVKNKKKTVNPVNVEQNATPAVLKTLLRQDSPPMVLVSTPSKLLQHLEEHDLPLLKSSLQLLAIDEADLLMGFGYENDMHALLPYFPKSFQCLILSSTLDASLNRLKVLFLKKPAILQLQDTEEDKEKAVENVKHFYLKFPEKETQESKYLILFVLLKLKLLKGKILIFTKDSETAYKLKLFLEMFFIKSVVINGELPLQSRLAMLQEANRLRASGKYDCLIAADPASNDLDHQPTLDDDDSDLELESEDPAGPAPDVEPRKKRSKDSIDQEFNVSRGIDFKDLSIVLNFDFPVSLKNYIHRTGRTGRGIKSGIALSFISTQDEAAFAHVKNNLLNPSKLPLHGESKNTPIPDTSSLLQPFAFNFDHVDGFRYRAMDTLASITRNTILEAKAKDLQRELVNNSKLAQNLSSVPLNNLYLLGSSAKSNHDSRKLVQRVTHLSSSSTDKSLVKHGKMQPQLRHIPEYLLMANSSSVSKKKKLPSGELKSKSSASVKMPELGADFVKMQELVLQQQTNRMNHSKHHPSKMNRKRKASTAKDPIKNIKL